MPSGTSGCCPLHEVSSCGCSRRRSGWPRGWRSLPSLNGLDAIETCRKRILLTSFPSGGSRRPSGFRRPLLPLDARVDSSCSRGRSPCHLSGRFTGRGTPWKYYTGRSRRRGRAPGRSVTLSERKALADGCGERALDATRYSRMTSSVSSGAGSAGSPCRRPWRLLAAYVSARRSSSGRDRPAPRGVRGPGPTPAESGTGASR